MAPRRKTADAEVAVRSPLLSGETASRIRHAYHRLSRGQRRLAQLTLEAPAIVAVSSAARVAEELGTSTSTVVRFATSLGYAGYPDFQRSLQGELFRDISTVYRLQVTRGELADQSAPAMITDALERDARYVLETGRLASPDEFQLCVDSINGARRVYVIGMWISHAPAYLLSIGLRFIGVDARLIGVGAGDVGDDLSDASEKDVIVAVSLHRYPTKAVAALDLAQRAHLRRIAITDDPIGSLGVRADHALYVKSGEDRFFQSVTAAVSMVNALITACAVAAQDRTQKVLADLEDNWAVTGAFVAETMA